MEQNINFSLKKWFAVYTRPRFEKKVKEELIKQDIECYLPTQKVLSFWKDRKKWIEKVLFTSYIFVKITKKDFFKVLNTDGVVKFISIGKQACEIQEKQIETIKLLIENNFAIITETYEFNIGEEVEIIAGGLKGIKGKLTDYKGKQKVVLTIDAINTCMLVEIENKYLKPI